LLSIFSFSFLFHNRAGKQERPSVLFFIFAFTETAPDPV